MDRPAHDPSTPAVPPPGAARASFRRFLVVGSTCTVVHYGLQAVMIEVLGWWPALASGLAFVAGAVLNYELSRRWTFFGREASWRSFVRFVTVAVFGLVLNVAIFESLLRAGVPHWLIAQVVATGVVMLSNFTLYRVWAFRH